MSIIKPGSATVQDNTIELWDQLANWPSDADGHTSQELFGLLGHEHPFVRWQAAEALAGLAARARTQRQGIWPRPLQRGQQTAMQELLAVATDYLVTDKADHRAAVIDALGQWHYVGSLGLLREGLDDPKAVVRSAAVHALGANQDIDSTDRLLDILRQDRSHWVRIAAAEALSHLAQPRIAPALCDLVQTLDDGNADSVLEETSNASERSMLRLHVIDTLGHLDHPQARELLMTVAQGEDATLRWYAARGLQRIGDAAALIVLKTLLTDETMLFDRSVAQVAQDAIEMIRHREHGLVAWVRQAGFAVSRLLKRIGRARQK